MAMATGIALHHPELLNQESGKSDQAFMGSFLTGNASKIEQDS
jgi:hypothetical protein